MGLLVPPSRKHPDLFVHCHTKRLQNCNVIVGLPTVLGKRMTGILCLLQGPEIVIEAYRKVKQDRTTGRSKLNLSDRLLANLLPYRR